MNGLEWAGVVADALLATAAVTAPRPRVRALATLGALALTPALLLDDLSGSGRLQSLTERPAVPAAAAALALAVVVAGAALASRRPALVAVAAVIAMPFRIPLGIAGDTANLLVPLYGVIAAGALASAACELRGRAAPVPPRPRALTWLLLGFVTMYALQAGYSSDLPKALEQIVFFYVPFALLFKLLVELEWTPAMLRACLIALAALALLFCAVGFTQYATRTVWINDKLLQNNRYTTYFRVNSVFFDPNVYGRFLVTVIVAVTAAALWSSRPRAVVAGSALVAVLWAGLLTTRSESSMVALVLGVAVLAALRGEAGGVLRRSAPLAGVVTVLAVVAAAVAGGSSLSKATSGRSELVGGGIGLFAERPLLGWGSGSFAREYRRQGKARAAATVSASHTIPVTVAAEQGLVGLAAYVALLVAAFAVLLRGARASPARAAVAAVFAALVLHTLLYAGFLEDPLAWILLAAGIALRAAPAGAAAPPRRAADPATHTSSRATSLSPTSM